MTLFRVLTCLENTHQKHKKKIKLIRLLALWKNQTQDFLFFLVDRGAGVGWNRTISIPWPLSPDFIQACFILNLMNESVYEILECTV